MEPYNIDKKYLSKIFLDLSIETNNLKTKISGYNIFLYDHPSDSKRNNVSIYNK